MLTRALIYTHQKNTTQGTVTKYIFVVEDETVQLYQQFVILVPVKALFF